METRPATILLQNFDTGEIVLIAELAQKELTELIDSDNAAPQIITPNLIKSYFRENGDRDVFGTGPPLLPDWYQG